MKSLTSAIFPFLVPALLYAGQTPLINQPWGGLFTLRQSDNGDTFSVAAVCSDQSNIYLYDLANGKVLRFDTTGALAQTVTLEAIGRGAYAGDDFVALGNEFVFLNTVDKRLEVFDAATGAHLRALNFPTDVLAEEKKRSWRIITRIFVDNGTVYIGNEHVAIPLESSLAKKSALTKALRMSGTRRIALVGAGIRLTTDGSRITGTSRSSYRIPKTNYPIPGKRFISINNQIGALVLSKQGVMVVVIK
jgi:hypothetical protein